MTSNDEIVRILLDLRRENADGRDSIMHRIGSLEGTSKTMATEIASVRALSERAERTAIEAKKVSADTVHETRMSMNAVAKHVAMLEEQIAKQATAAQAELQVKKLAEIRMILIAYVPVAVGVVAIITMIAHHFLE